MPTWREDALGGVTLGLLISLGVLGGLLALIVQAPAIAAAENRRHARAIIAAAAAL
jgi:hypothetical protein